MAGGKMRCASCGKDISMAGVQMCSICDPDMMVILERTVQQKTPPLCDACFKGHVESHEGAVSPTPQSELVKRCPNCGSTSFRGDTCFQCGGSPRIG